MNGRRAYTALAVVLAGCGGGGPDAGQCVFAPADCGNIATGASGVPSAPAAGILRQGSGDDTFTLPLTYSVIRIQGSFTGASQNFIVNVGQSLIINTIIGTERVPSTHDGTYTVTPGSLVSISRSSGVSWSIWGTQAEASTDGGAFAKSGTGDSVFKLPSRASTYRIRASVSSGSANFVVLVGGRLVVNEILGEGSTPAVYEGRHALESGATVEIVKSPGVDWRFEEAQ